MVINEKALVTQMKEAYKNGGYTVAAVGTRMMFTNGVWLATIDRDNVPRALLGLLAEHIRDIPSEGEAYNVTKTKNGPLAQTRILTEAIQPWAHMNERKQEGIGCHMRRSNLTLSGLLLWQETDGQTMYMIDPRYAVMFENHFEVVRLGNGIYAEGEISELWVLRNVDSQLEDQLEHLQKIRWVK